MLTQNLIATLKNYRHEEKILPLGIDVANEKISAAEKNLKVAEKISAAEILPYSVDISAKAIQLQHANKNLQLSENYLSPSEKIFTAQDFINVDSDIGQLAHETLSKNLSQVIGKILTPYETYEEAQINLYQKPVSGYSFNTDGASLTMTAVQDLPGAFGLLANSLNNYSELFGHDSEYFSQLTNALDKLDPNENDDLINQIKSMIKQVQSGSTIAIKSTQFMDDVTSAVEAAYSEKNFYANENKRVDKNKSLNRHDENFFMEMQRREAEQQGELLDKLLGKKTEHKSETPADILNRREVEPPDHSIRDQLRKPDEPQEEFSFTAAQVDESEPTKLSATEFERRKNISSAWDAISAENNWSEPVDKK